MRGVIVAVVLTAMLATLPSCGDDPSAGSSAVRARISGSGTCIPLLRVLTDEYEREGAVSFAYLPGLHSGGGITGVANGDLDIGAVSRELTEEEQDLGLEYITLSDDGLALAVHPSVGITGLTSEQVRDIYAGRHEMWSELGGADVRVVVLDRNEDESAKIILRQYVLEDLPVTDQAVVLAYEQDMADGIQRTPGAIGYFSLGLGISEDLAVEYLFLDGVAPTVENIESGVYRMTRPLGIVVPASSPTGIAGFVSWATSDEARNLARERGFAPPLGATGE